MWAFLKSEECKTFYELFFYLSLSHSAKRIHSFVAHYKFMAQKKQQHTNISADKTTSQNYYKLFIGQYFHTSKCCGVFGAQTMVGGRLAS